MIVTTPDHWHARMVIDAVEAGKDVSVEKPLAHTIEEGFRIIEAVRRTKRVVQVGMQRRSFDLFQEGKSIMDPNATVEMGQHTNVVLCMAIEALRSGRRMKWNAQRKAMEA